MRRNGNPPVKGRCSPKQRMVVKGNSRISPSSVGIRQGPVGKERSPIRVKGTMLESYRIPFLRRTRSAHIVWGPEGPFRGAVPDDAAPAGGRYRFHRAVDVLRELLLRHLEH